jgi:hypothetical protein
MDAPEAERLLIRGFRKEGARLVNGTDGGDGTVGRKHTPESRAKMSANQKGKRLGVPQSLEHKTHVTATKIGKKRSAAARANMSLAQRRRYEDPAEHEKASAGQLRRYSRPEEHEKSKQAKLRADQGKAISVGVPEDV